MASAGTSTEQNVGLAFGMVTAAGLCTSLGALAAFFVPLENKRFLAVSLALSAGVMIYVSMVEIFVKALSAFSDEWCPERLAGDTCPRAYSAVTGAFFAGILTVALLNALVSPASIRFVQRRLGCGPPDEEEKDRDSGPGTNDWSMEALHIAPGWEVKVSKSTGKPFYVNLASGDVEWERAPLKEGFSGLPSCVCDAPSQQLPGAPPVPPAGFSGSDTLRSEPKKEAIASTSPRLPRCSLQLERRGSAAAEEEQRVSIVSPRKHPDVEARAKLNATGLITGLAIAIHNFPEGLATFVAALAEPSLGAAVAVAIAIHNIPEGVCVAMPIYYATGSRVKAFLWATLSGVSEPIGAAFGWAVLGGDVSNISYGFMFGMVAGMMVYISLAELLPAAYRQENAPRAITGALVFGMIIMAISLVAFQL